MFSNPNLFSLIFFTIAGWSDKNCVWWVQGSGRQISAFCVETWISRCWHLFAAKKQSNKFWRLCHFCRAVSWWEWMIQIDYSNCVQGNPNSLPIEWWLILARWVMHHVVFRGGEKYPYITNSMINVLNSSDLTWHLSLRAGMKRMVVKELLYFWRCFKYYYLFKYIVYTYITYLFLFDVFWALLDF